MLPDVSLLDLLREEAGKEGRTILLAASLAGFANAVILAMVNQAAQSEEGASVRLFVIIALAGVLYLVCARRTFDGTTAVIETALLTIKCRIVEKIDRAELQGIERIGSSEIYDRLTENVSVLSDSAVHIANLLQSACILVCAILYLASISLPAFVLLSVINVIGINLYLSKNKEIDVHLAQAAETRVAFLDRLSDLLKGFKEVKFSGRRSRDLREDITQTSRTLRTVTVKANNLFNGNWIFAQCVLYAMLVAMVFVLPQHVEVEASTLPSLVGGVLFFWGPLSGVVGGAPAYLRSSMALANIQALEKKLDEATREVVAAENAIDPWRGSFSAIEARAVTFAYPADEGGEVFRVGPASLTLAAGEVVFLVGGNGSGKSTLVKVLTGLYLATTGTLRASNVTVDAENVSAYREMFSTIFSDFHLFSRLYGLLGVAPEAVLPLLREMRINDKTSFVDGRFTNRNLSTGQRKRLAMVVTLLEDRPICVFDEWAADQDPEFRRYFYEELVPALKQRGKTVLAVTHDDRYFHCADRVITMEQGKLRSITESAATTPG